MGAVDASERIAMKGVLCRGVSEIGVAALTLAPPRRGEVLVRVAAAGVCHSDLHLVDGHLGTSRFPIVPGHEGSGVVVGLGDTVEDRAVGQRVAFSFIPACRQCRECLAGRFQLCTTVSRHSADGTLFDGTTRLASSTGETVRHYLLVSSFAQYAVLPVAATVPVPDDLPLWQAALVGCAVLTAAGAVRNAARVRLGDTVAVVGCGGVGLQVVAAARLAGAARILAIDINDGNLARARSYGATECINSGVVDVRGRVRDLCPAGVDHALEVVGAAATIRLAWDIVGLGGRVTVVGLAQSGVEVSLPAREFLAEKTIVGTRNGSANAQAELPALMRLVADGRLDLSTGVSSVTDLAGIPDALGRLRRGDGARTVAVIDAETAGDAAGGLSIGG